MFRSRGWIEEDYARLDEYARKAAEGAPSLTEAQMKRLGELLRPIKAG